MSTDDAESVAAGQRETAIPYPLLLDPDGLVAGQFGIRHFDEDNQRWVARPSIFLLDWHGVVRFAHIGEHTRDRPAIGALLLALGSIK